MSLAELFNAKAKKQPVDVRTWVLTHQPETYAQWKEWVREVGLIIEGAGLVFSDEPVIEGHGVPLKWGYELYCLGCGRRWDGSFEPFTEKELAGVLTEYVIKASRKGGKTLMIAIVGFSLCVWNEDYQWNHTAAVLEQADRVWGYLRRLVDPNRSPLLNKHLAKRPTKDEITFANGSCANITTGTGEGQNSKHPQFSTYDEVEYMNIDVIREGRLAAGRKRRADGMHLPSVTAYISTQKKANQTMFTLIQEAKAGKKKLVLSSVFDVIEKCPDWRTEDLPEGLSCGDWDAISHRIAYLVLNQASAGVQARIEMQALEHRRDLLKANCPLVEDCKGVCKRASGWYSITDAANKCTDRPYWRAQMLSLQPQMEHAVYSQFSEEDNVTDDAEIRTDLPVDVFIDYGFMQDPTYIGLGQTVGSYVTVFAELLVENVSSDLIPELLRKFLASRDIKVEAVRQVAPDPSASELRKHLRNAGFNVVVRHGKNARSIAYGVDKVAELIYNSGHRKLLIHPRCELLIENLLVYERDASGLPKSRQWDHPVDALRYWILWLMLQGRAGSRNIKPGRSVGTTTR